MHKGDRGRVLVVGGDEGMVGAAIHAARAALAAGAGLVKLAGSEAAVRAANETLPDALTFTTTLGPTPEAGLLSALDWADAVIMGPGLGRGAPRRALVSAMLEAVEGPMVVDADALHLGGPAWGTARGARVLTPHAGEFGAAFPALAAAAAGDRFAAASEAAASSRCVVLFKGVPTVVAAPDNPSLVVAAGTPGLATGGSGDVLAGFIGAFLARGLAPQAAAALGALALGRAAEIAATTVSTRAARPADVMAAVPTLWKDWGTQPRVDPPVLAWLPPPPLV
jgi:NAD(P)H-hydrate epimerase